MTMEPPDGGLRAPFTIIGFPATLGSSLGSGWALVDAAALGRAEELVADWLGRALADGALATAAGMAPGAGGTGAGAGAGELSPVTMKIAEALLSPLVPRTVYPPGVSNPAGGAKVRVATQYPFPAPPVGLAGFDSRLRLSLVPWRSQLNATVPHPPAFCWSFGLVR
ncbi:hypothetical protein HC028_21470 [Planosporangium flavigriseum]|nr:hypothetical protein [Planosporangium flavigriseum]NJC67051.1 hypothetical protein [Planosporangium flavigriseum]